MDITPAEHQKARRHLARRDPVMKRLIAAIGPCTLRHEPDRFAALARSIISQQISTKAAASIQAKLKAAAKKKGISADGVRALSDEAMRAAGLSTSKMRYLRDLADRVHTKAVRLDRLHELPDEEVIACLLPILGIGPWTAQMFLIFSLSRLDVLAVDDLGLRAAVRQHYGLSELPDRAQLTELAECWRPYRSIATWYLWRSRGFVPQSDGR
jgi:DNA-3-methyladenine glycosylase II